MDKNNSQFLKELKFFWRKCAFAPCVWQLEAVHFDCPYPVGSVYLYRISTASLKTKKNISITLILDSYVQPYYRRRGVRSAMNVEIGKYANVILSGFGTKLGNAFMKSQKYKEMPFGMFKEINK